MIAFYRTIIYICNKNIDNLSFTMVNSTEFAKRLQKVLDFYGLSATAFSEKIDFNRSTISHLLSGRNKPSLEFVMKVLNQFPEVGLYWLLNGTGNFPSTSSSEKEYKIPKSVFQQIDDDSGRISDKKKKISENDPEIEKIVIFYKDGSFKAYE